VVKTRGGTAAALKRSAGDKEGRTPLARWLDARGVWRGRTWHAGWTSGGMTSGSPQDEREKYHE
jgi:hypothetical protein